jgi:Homeodomain-like domain
MRKGIEVDVGADDRARLEAIVADRNCRQKYIERARIVLLTGDGVGTLSIMREVGCAKATVWRWQERFMAAGVDGLLQDKSRPPGKTPLAKALVERVVDLTLGDHRQAGRGHPQAGQDAGRCRGRPRPAPRRKSDPCSLAQGGCPPRPHEPERPDPSQRSRSPGSYTT